jgi:hypothetical protein
VAVGQPYTLQYEETFDTDPNPPWETNNPACYYRDVNAPGFPAPAYRGIMYDNTSEYGTVPLAHDGRSFRITFDLLIDSMNWGGDFGFGWYDASRECFYHAPERQMFKLAFGIGDLGKGISLTAWDDAGAEHFTGEYPTESWTTNVWYRVTFTYDKNVGALLVELRDAATGILRWTGIVEDVSGFNTLAHLGLSKVSDTYAPSASGKGWVDNVRVFTVGSSLLGDLNCDGSVDFGDINPFVLALTNPWSYWEQYPLCDIMNADLNCDGAPGFGDINPFVACVSYGDCDCP